MGFQESVANSKTAGQFGNSESVLNSDYFFFWRPGMVEPLKIQVGKINFNTDSFIQEETKDDFPPIGDEKRLYFAKTALLEGVEHYNVPYVWDNTAQAYEIANQTNLTFNKLVSILGFTPISSAEKGASDGIVPLVDGIIPSQYIAGIVDEVIEGEYVDSTTFYDINGVAVTPSKNKIYNDVFNTPRKQYRWGGNEFVETVTSPGSTDALAEGANNLYFTIERVRQTFLTGLTTNNNSAITAADNLITALGKLQSQINYIDYDPDSSTASPTRIDSWVLGYSSGLTFSPTFDFTIDGVPKTDSREITLATADATNPRVDVFVVNLSTEQIEVLTGTPAANPAEPDVDFSLYLKGPTVDIPAGATAPANIDIKTLYDENLGTAGGESDVSGGVDFDFANTENPKSGTKAIKVVGELSVNQSIILDLGTDFPIAQAKELQLDIQNINTGGFFHVTVYGKRRGGRTDSFRLPDITGFDAANIASYQTLTLPISSSQLESIYRVNIVNEVAGYKFYLDNVRFLGGEGTTAPTGDYVTRTEFEALDSEAVKKTGDQTIAGVKTFSSSPKIPDAVNNDEPVSKGQLDTAIAGVGGGSTPQPDYLTKAALLADQANQVEDEEYTMLNANGWNDPEQDAITHSNWATVKFLGANFGDERDYDLREQFDVDAPGTGSSAPVSKTGTNIVFTEDAFYNEQDYLTTGNLVLDLTGAVKGSLSIVYCDRYIPEITGEKYYLSGALNALTLNELWFFWNGTIIDLMVVNKFYLTAPENAIATPQDGQVTLENFAVINAEEYEIIFSTTDDINTASLVPNYNGTDITYTHTGLTNGNTYYYWIKAKGNGYLDSSYFKIVVIAGTSQWDKTGLVGYYEHDEISGSIATDSHSSANNGVLNNITLGNPGVRGNSYGFNGTSSFISYPGLNNKFSGDWTIMVWVKTTRTTYQRVLQNRGVGTPGSVKGFALSLNVGDFQSVLLDNGAGTSVTFGGYDSAYEDGNWHQLVLSFNKTLGRARIYEDGVIINGITEPDFVGVDFTGLDFLAGKSNQNSQYFLGDMDIISVFQKELTQSEVADHYENGNGKAY